MIPTLPSIPEQGRAGLRQALPSGDSIKSVEPWAGVSPFESLRMS
jgi:hypothetical protein